MKRAKQRQMFARGGAAVLSLAVIAAVGVAAMTALRTRRDGVAPPPSTPVATDDSAAVDPAADDSTAPPTDTIAVAVTRNSPLPAEPMVTAKQVTLVVPVGRSELRDTMIAERAGDTVRVSFDLLLSRTRRPDKFEAIMRSTLPQVYGASVDSALRALPVGAVARAGDLIETLPERGLHIPLTDGRTLAIWPVTRVGRDGPLVVAYRAVASR